MKIGVTGGNGFIGQWILRELKERGYRTLVADHIARDNEWADELMLVDVRDEVEVFELAAHVDGIIHLAAVLGTQETIQYPVPSAMTNIIGSLNVFEAATHYGIPVVYAGVGNHWMRTHGAGSYTISKTAAEDYARMFNAYRDGLISIVRPVNAYGPGQSVGAPYGSSKVRKIMPAFICRALAGDPIEVYGDGTQVSDCVYVGDVANVFVELLERFVKKSLLTPMTVEVGPDNSTSLTVIDIARMVRQEVQTITGKLVEIRHLPMRPGEVPNATVSADTRALRVLGNWPEEFKPLREGVKETVEYYVEEWLPEWEDNR